MTQVKVQVGLTTIEVVVDSVKDAVKQLSAYYDVFGESNCGRCSSTDVCVMHRENGGYDFYHMRCRACGCQIDFGQHQQGDTLFPKRKLADGSYDSEHSGWYHWKERQKDNGSSEQAGSNPF